MNMRNKFVIYHSLMVLTLFFVVTRSYSGIWLTEENISQDAFGSFLSESDGTNHSGIAVDSKNHPHAVWYGRTPSRIFYSNRTGSSWSTPINITSDTIQAKWTSIAIDSSDRLHIAWHDYRNASTTFNVEIYYNTASIGGSWNNETRLTNTQDVNMTNGDSGYSPTIVIDHRNFLHVVWYDFHWNGFNPDLAYKMATTGFSWNTTENIDSDRITFTQLYEQPFPSMASDTSNNIHLVWADDSTGNLEIYYKKKSGLSGLWSAETTLTNESSMSINPCIVSDSKNNLYVFWSDARDGNQEIYLKKYSSDSNQWLADQRLTNVSGISNHPSAASDSKNNIYLVWDDTRNGNQQIFYKKFDSQSQSWSSDTAISTGSGQSRYPSIAVDSLGNVHVLWQDNRDGNDEIYYREQTNATTIPIELWNYE